MIELLENLTIRPDSLGPGSTAGDLLSHVLSQIRLTGNEVFSRTLAGAEQLDFHEACVIVVTEGAMTMERADERPLVIETGDLVLLPRGLGETRLAASLQGAAVFVCRFWFDPGSLPGMLVALPHCIHIRHAQGAEWIGGMLHFMKIEADDVQPGATLMISRIIDLVVIRALRTWVHEGNTAGWLGGLADPRIARSLKSIHENPTQRWSISALADHAGMSRSNFCERFAALVGRSPLRYQNEWRLGLAREMLSRRDARVGEIGLRIGYESEAAFSRAYKQLFGHSPRAEYAAVNESGKPNS
jgi:AraC-like DNA-binding protein